MPGKTYPRPWMRLDREYLNQDTILELGKRFGPVGPLVFLALMLEAGKSPAGGAVDLRLATLARLAFTDAETVGHVIAALGEPEIGLLADLGCEEGRFRGRLTRWERWEAKDPTSAQRSADYRARNADS